MDKEFQQVLQGRVPAKQTQEFMLRCEAKFDNIEDMTNKVTTKIALMEQKIDIVCEKLEQHVIDQKEQFSVQKDQISGLSEKIDNFIASSDSRYASKAFQNTMEKISWAIAFLIVGGVITAVLKLVLK